MPFLGLVPTTLALLLTIAPGEGPATRPPTAEEQKAFSAGLRLFDNGDARGAERTWRAGYAIGRDPAFLVRIGEAQEKAGAPTEAAQTYRQYLTESPRAADRAEIAARIARLIPNAAPKPQIEVEAPGEMRGAPGSNASPGEREAITEPLPSGSGPPATGRAPAPTASTAPQAFDEDADPAPLFPSDGKRSRLNVAGWVGVGTTTVALAVAAFFGASASDKAGDANRLLTYRDRVTGMPQEYGRWADQFEEDLRVGRRDEKIALGLLLTAGVTAVASTVLFVLDSHSENPQPEPRQSANTRLKRPVRPHQIAGDVPTRRRGPTLTANSPGGAVGRGAGLTLGWSF